MAVTTTIESYAQYYTEGCPIRGCLNGGDDYKTLDPDTKNIQGGILAIRGWCGDDISEACEIVDCKITFLRYTKSGSGGSTSLKGDCDYTVYGLRRDSSSSGGVSGSIISSSLTQDKWSIFSVTADKNIKGVVVDFDESEFTRNVSSSKRIAKNHFPAVKMVFWSGNALFSVRYHIKEFKIAVTRTRACYITFKGDGVTEKTTMYDYGTVPSYGSTPTRAGYTFKGWSNGSTTYSGTLPTAYEQDVIYTAVWERVTYYLDLNGLLDGSSSGSISPYGTADVYIKGSLAAKGVSDYYTAHPEGTTYEIKNIKANTGYKYNGNASYSGTLTADTSVVLSFSTKTDCTITYNGNGATSGSVAAQSGYVGDSLTLRDNGFYKKCIVAFYSNEDPSIEDDSLDELQPSESSATFLGWYTAASGGSQVTSPYTPTSASVTLYAHWSGMSAVTTPTLTRDGYTFLGWYTARSGGSKVADGGSYTPSGTIALYAHWKLNEITDIYIGTSILDVYLGSSKVDVYQGTTKIYG